MREEGEAHVLERHAYPLIWRSGSWWYKADKIVQSPNLAISGGDQEREGFPTLKRVSVMSLEGFRRGSGSYLAQYWYCQRVLIVEYPLLGIAAVTKDPSRNKCLSTIQCARAWP